MSKRIQCGNEFDVLYLRGKKARLGGAQGLLPSRATLLLRGFRQERVLQRVGSGNRKQGMTGWEAWHLHMGLAGSVF